MPPFWFSYLYTSLIAKSLLHLHVSTGVPYLKSKLTYPPPCLSPFHFLLSHHTHLDEVWYGYPVLLYHSLT